MNLAEKLAKRRQDIKDRSAGGSVNFIKEGTLRIRIKPHPEDVDWAVEAKSFYLGGDIKGVFSRASEAIGEECPILEKFEELKASKKPGASDLAKKLSPRTKYLVAAIVYADEKGTEIDEQKSGRLTQLPTGIYTSLIDYWLDTDIGDFTDVDDGYDIKIKRTGKGINDTEYSLIPVKKNTPTPKGYTDEVDPMDLFVEDVLLSYEECENKLAEFLVATTEEDDDEPRKPKKRREGKSRRRKKKD